VDAERAAVRRCGRAVVQAAVRDVRRPLSVGGRRARTRLDRLRADRPRRVPSLRWHQRRIWWETVMKAPLLAVALMLVAMPAAAQSADTRWEPFLGCWQMTADNVRDATPAAAPLAGAALPSRARNTAGPRVRSEKHTSELQSQSNLVCRLLLEKKNGDK